MALSDSGQRDEARLVMGGEDFARMMLECPGTYNLMGNEDCAPVHHPEYNFNDDAIPARASFWIEFFKSWVHIMKR